MAIPTKGVECFFWKNGDNCHYTEEECKFAHHLTGKQASAPYTSQFSSQPHISRATWRSGEPTEGSDSSSTSSPSQGSSTSLKPSITKPEAIETWAAVLPVIEFPFEDLEDLQSEPISMVLHSARFETLDNTRLCWALQNAPDFTSLEEYLGNFPTEEVKQALSSHHGGVAPVFYAVSRHCIESVRLLIQFGADVNARLPSSDVPLLAFTVINGWMNLKVPKSTDVVRALLAAGANWKDIPRDLWEKYILKPGDKLDLAEAHSGSLWCTEHIRPIISAALNLTQRYLLLTADEASERSQRTLDIAKLTGINAMLELQFFVIAQRYAIKIIQDAVINTFMDPDGGKRPLVLLFAGPSGHGKTEVARSMGRLLSLPLEFVDFTQMARETDLFGPQKPYQGWATGSPLNLFLKTHSGQAAVVFLDEFEKTNLDLHQALLLPLENGIYRDRTSEKSDAIDCSKIIWVMASNLFDDEILAFYSKHLHGKSTEQRRHAPYKALDKKLRAKLRNRVKNLSGRIGTIVPFFPFSDDEAAVVAHKSILRITEILQAPVDPDNGRLVGGIHVELTDDGSICKDVAVREYEREDGARSIEYAITKEIKYPLFEEFRNGPQKSWEELSKAPLMKMVVEMQPDGEGGEAVKIMPGGTIAAPRNAQPEQDGEKKV